MTQAQLNQYISDLRRDGYKPVLPPSDDFVMASTWPCSCGHVGMSIQWFARAGSSVAVYRCPSCGKGGEY